MNDHDMPPDQAQQDGYERKLAELLDLLETVDGQLTPRHVARQFRELLADSGTGGRCTPAASRTDLQQFGIVFESDLHGACTLSGHPAPGVTDSLLHVTLREAAKARATARRDVEAASRRAEEMQDTALAKAARIETAAREKAERILAEARQAAARVVRQPDAGLEASVHRLLPHLEPAGVPCGEVTSTAAELVITLLPETSKSRMPETWWS
jgi:hypothetical protein